MKTPRLLSLVALSFFLTTPSFAAEAVSAAGPGEDGAANRSAPPQPLDADTLDQLARAKVMPALPMPQGDRSAHRSGPVGYRADELGTVSQDADGQVSTTPVSPEVQQKLKSGGPSMPPPRSEAPSFRGALDPVGGPRVTRQVFGADDRVHIRYITEYPFRAIGLILFDTADGSYLCSGTLIGQRYVLTAAHCVFDFEHHAWVTNLKFFPGADGNNTPYGYYPYARLTALSGFVDAPSRTYDWEHMRHDMAIVTLQGNPGNRVGWLAIGYNDSLPPFVGNIVGYPADKRPPGLMWRSSCNIINPADGYPDLLETQCDTFGGSSGSSVYDFDEQTKGRIIYGVNVAENSQFNSSVRITGPLYCWLTGTMGQNC